MKITLNSGRMTETVDIPGYNFLGILEPPVLPEPDNRISQIITNAIESPIGYPRLEKLVNSKSKVAIIVDDISRPTPSKEVLEVLLKKLDTLGVSKEQIKITIANGLHRATTEKEKIKIVGKELLREFDVVDNDAENGQSYTYIGTTSNDTAVLIHERVVEADVIITIGMIKSHGTAGFTGGAKSILPGVSAKQTILANHRFDFIEYPRGLVGDADLSHLRKDIEETAKLLDKPLFIINVVMDANDKIRGIFSGDVIKAHRKGVEFFRQLAEVDMEEQADIILLESNYPSSESLYFALAGLATVLAAKKPAVKAGGSVVMYSQCRTGIGAEIIESLFNSFDTIYALREHLKTSVPVKLQWAAQRLAFYVQEWDIAIVTEGIEKSVVERMNMKYFDSLQEAVDDAFSRYGKDVKFLVVKNADYLLINVK